MEIFHRNKNTDTIDDALIDGLHKACVISDSNYYDEKRFIKVTQQFTVCTNLRRMDGIVQPEQTRVFTQQGTSSIVNWKWSRERKKRLWSESIAVFPVIFVSSKSFGIRFSFD